MKKQLLTLFAALTVVTVQAQTSSPHWTINQQAVFPTSPTFTAQGVKFIDAVDSNVVWTIGMDWNAPRRNYNWYSVSANGGATFTGGNVFSDTSTYIIANMEGIDASTAWVSSFMKSTQSQGAIHRTTDGGQTWVNMTASGMYTNSAAFTNVVTFLTPSLGITQGDPVNGEFEIWRTTNGGLSWTQVPGSALPNPLNNEYMIVDLYYKLGTSHVWFGTNAGRMYRTTDAGITWSVATVGSTSDILLEIAFTSPLNGITYVWNGTSTDVYNTTDGGATWTQIFPTGNIGLADIRGIPGTGILASFGFQPNAYLSYSSDNGLSWTDWGSTNISYIAGDFSDPAHGWAGTFDMPNSPFFTNIWKYSGAVLAGTVAPTSAFSLPASLCLSASNVTTSASNSSSGSQVLTYSWSASPADVLFSSTTATNPALTFTATGTYTIYLTTTNSFGSNTTSQIIAIQACSLPTADFMVAQQACINVGLPLVNTSTGGSPSPSYSWAVSGNVTISPSPFASSPTITATSAGIYTIYLTGSNSQGSVQATRTVNIQDCSPVVSFTLPEIVHYCDSVKPKFTAINGTPVNSGAGPNTYTWSVAPSVNIQQTNVTAINYTVTISHTAIPMYTVTLRAKNNSGSSILTQTIEVDFLCLGLDEQNNPLLNLAVFPNPARENVTIVLPSGSENYRVKLINVLGAVVYEETISKGNREKKINVANMPKGVYFLKIEAGANQGTRKLIIE